MSVLVVGNDYLSNRFAYLLKKLSLQPEKAPRFSKSLLKGKEMVFFAGKNCLAKSMMESLRAGCSVFSEQLLFEEKSDLSLIRYAERNDLRLSIGSFDVFNPVIEETKKILSKESVFELFFNRTGPRQFGYVRLNIVDDLVIQDIGIMTHLLGEDIRVVSARSDDTYNRCIAHLKCGGTNILAYANKNTYYKERTLEAFAERIRLHANILTQSVLMISSEGISQSLYGTGYESYKEHLVKKAEPLELAIRNFIKGKANYGLIETNMRIALEIKKMIFQPIRPIS